MRELAIGNLHKMQVSLGEPIHYQLRWNEQSISLNQYIGKRLELFYQGSIYCIQCGRKTTKSFQQGYCFPCMRRLAECNYCIIHPEKCRCEQEPCPTDDWAHAHCNQPHIVYLANSSGLKVGITRESQIPTRWIDQGAIQALAILRVANRYQAGKIEVCLKQLISDKTNWRKLLRADIAKIDLLAVRDELLAQVNAALQQVLTIFKLDDISFIEDAEPVELSYPILTYPECIRALSLDKTPHVGGVLQGIKGQYLLFDCGVINIRKFAGYSVAIQCSNDDQ